MKAAFESPAPESAKSALNLRAVDNETLLTKSPGRLTRHCDWMNLVPINFRNVAVFFVYNGITKTTQLDFRSNGLDYKLDGSIPGYESIHGSLLFDTRVKCAVENEEVQYRFYGETFSGGRYDQSSNWGRASKNPPLVKSSEARTSGPVIVTMGGQVDLSAYTPKFFSDLH